MNTQWFVSLPDAQQQWDTWRQEYNVSRPHGALPDWTPAEFASNHAAKGRIEEVKPASKLALQLA
ncbi:MAG TPA: hypothetical protein DD706_15370 [Nitrospiraceae bacterium]|nr:hypothetical protein [Nitrospiraceae bacterium]